MEAVTLEEMLAFRESKVKYLERLRKRYPENVVITLGMNIPGPHKTGKRILQAFHAGTDVIEDMLSVGGFPVLDESNIMDKAGYIKFYVVHAQDIQRIKQRMVEIEERHCFGRLFDIDVYRPDGSSVSREELNLPQRRCLICNGIAKECGRSRKHSVEELEAKVEEIICKGAARSR